MLVRLLRRVLGLDALDLAYDRAVNMPDGVSVVQKITEGLGLRAKVTLKDLLCIPKNGSLIVVVNHPTGGWEGVFPWALLDMIRSDVKTIAHNWFQCWPRVAERMILVNPQAGPDGRTSHSSALKEAVRWLRKEKALLIFPAGEVARFRFKERKITESAWQPGLALLAKLTHATVLPIHVSVRNSLLYYILSMIHPRLGVFLLGRELLKLRGKIIHMRIGKPIPFDQVPNSGSTEDLLAFYKDSLEKLDRLA